MGRGEDAASRTSALLNELWKRNLPRVLERLNRLDFASACAASQTLDPTLLQEAVEIAHKLAGSLGMFGHHQGTLFAREIEVLLQNPDLDAVLLNRLTLLLRSSLPLT